MNLIYKQLLISLLLLISCIEIFDFRCIYANNLKAELEGKLRGKIPEWISTQIAHDLRNSPKVITAAMVDKAFKESQGHVVRCKIVNGNISCIPNITISTSLMLHDHLVELNKHIQLPDVDFIIVIDDGPAPLGYSVPVFGFCKNKYDKNFILIPDYQILDFVAKEQGLQQIQAAINLYPWNKKICKAIWRGANTGILCEEKFRENSRIKAAMISKVFPHLIDAKINLLYGSEYLQEQIKTAGYMGQNLSIAQHMQYKYQLLLDGNCASWPGAYWRFNSNCVVFKQTSDQIQWYYLLLQPYVHYIPISNDLNNLIPQIAWAINNDGKVLEIVKNAKSLAANSLSYADMLYYIYIAITTYAKMQR